VFARKQAMAHPDKPAVIMAASGETVTFGDYEARSNRAAHLLRGAGLRRGDHIAVFIENSPQLLEIEGGAERAGLYYSLINTYLGADEVAYIVANSQAKALFSSVAKREVAEAAAASCPGLDRRLMTGSGPLPAGWEPYDAVVAGYPADPVPDESLGAAMLYSSGTTGQPKGILRNLPTIGPDEPLPVMQFVRGLFGFREGMTYLSPAPLYHSAPQASVSAALRLGSTVIVMEHFDPEQWLALVERYRVTHCQMVPVMFNHGGRRLHVLHRRRVARAPWHRRPHHSRRAAHPGRRGKAVPDRGGRDDLVPRRDRLQVLPGSGEDRGKPLRRRPGQHRGGCRPRGRGRVPVPDRPQELHDHLRRGQHLPAGD
jgi:acyl-CoA synthetase (AMP-forming)/AMP-acid ligase II